eukprot:gene22612-biopygen8781
MGRGLGRRWAGRAQWGGGGGSSLAFQRRSRGTLFSNLGVRSAETVEEGTAPHQANAFCGAKKKQRGYRWFDGEFYAPPWDSSQPPPVAEKPAAEEPPAEKPATENGGGDGVLDDLGTWSPTGAPRVPGIPGSAFRRRRPVAVHYAGTGAGQLLLGKVTMQSLRRGAGPHPATNWPMPATPRSCWRVRESSRARRRREKRQWMRPTR